MVRGRARAQQGRGPPASAGGLSDQVAGEFDGNGGGLGCGRRQGAQPWFRLDCQHPGHSGGLVTDARPVPAPMPVGHLAVDRDPLPRPDQHQPGQHSAGRQMRAAPGRLPQIAPVLPLSPAWLTACSTPERNIFARLARSRCDASPGPGRLPAQA